MKKEYIKPTSKVVITKSAILAGSGSGPLNIDKNGDPITSMDSKRGAKVNFLDDDDDYEF